MSKPKNKWFDSIARPLGQRVANTPVTEEQQDRINIASSISRLYILQSWNDLFSLLDEETQNYINDQDTYEEALSMLKLESISKLEDVLNN